MNPRLFQPQNLSDDKLVELTGLGDEQAFAALYARHKDYVMRLAMRFTRDSETSADVVQETFIYLMRKASTLTLTAKLTTYLYPVVKNISLTIVRKSRARLGLTRPDGTDADVAAPPAAAARDPEALASIVQMLPEHQREVLLMRFVDDMSMEQIAIALEIPVGTVKSRLHLAIKVLREDPRTTVLFGQAANPPGGNV